MRTRCSSAEKRVDSPFDPAAERYVCLATYRRNGKEIRTPVWIAGSAGCYYLFSAGNAGKVKRIRANGRARLAACNFSGAVSSDWLEAQARVVSDVETIAAAYAALHAKYGWQMKIGDWLAKLSGRYRKRAIIEVQVTE